ncbi:hypothetical protein E2C01_045165 [Portunus trituberculatus]|uniref:Uncharacterized protein n=1 Tax=Portunus trituberculatus TaxID=210409 RepID=A0A5B7FV06_PORTR|nr:hypothetical protein [Portunus trituberculatus]
MKCNKQGMKGKVKENGEEEKEEKKKPLRQESRNDLMSMGWSSNTRVTRLPLSQHLGHDYSNYYT